MLPSETEHFTSDGQPLLTATQLESVYGIKRRTVYAWRSRKFIAVRGLDEDGTELYAAGEVAAVKAKPRHRSKIAA